MTRRAVLAGAALLAATARAEPAPAMTVPQVDGVAVQVLDDSATFGPFLDPIDLPGLRVTRAGNGGPPRATRMQPQAMIGDPPQLMGRLDRAALARPASTSASAASRR